MRMMQKFFMDELFFLYLVVINFRYFNEEKIDQPLHAVQPFRQALFMVEDVIDNDQLCRYFSYMINAELREENLFDPNKALEHVNETRNSLKEICSRLSFTMEDLPDDYSRFQGIRGQSSKYDLIIFNSDMINPLLPVGSFLTHSQRGLQKIYKARDSKALI